MITYKRDRILIASFWGNYGKEHHLFLWLLEKMESTQHFWCLDGERGGKLVWRGSLCAVGCTSLRPVGCLGMACLLLRYTPEAGFSSACSNSVDSLVPSVSLWISCGMVQSQGFLWVTKTSFLLCPVSEFDGWTSCSFRFAFLCFVLFYFHCVLQLLVYMRVVEFVCTLISSLLKCVWFNNFLVSLRKLLRPRSFLGWRKFIHCPPPPGWHKSLPPSARPEHSSFD